MGIPSILRNVKSTKNFIKSRQIMRKMNKAFEAGDDAIYYSKYNPGDIRSLSYFRDENEVAKAVAKGRTEKIQYRTDKIPIKHTYVTPQEAQESVNEALSRSKINTTKDIISEIAKDAMSLHSGNKVSLITDGDLSKDSYPLIQSVFTRHQLNGDGIVSVVKDGDTYRMIELNHYGQNPKSLKRIDKSIKTLRNITGDPNIPGRYSIGPYHYVPAIEYTKYRFGGILNLQNLTIKSIFNEIHN